MDAIKKLGVIVLGILDMGLMSFIQKGTMGSTFAIFVGIIVILATIDFITGITKAKKMGQRITSSRAFITIIKLFVYLTILILLYSLATFYKSDIVNNAVIALSALGVIIEAKSIAENIEAVFDINLPFLDILDPLSSILGSLVKKFSDVIRGGNDEQ
ncbi:MAG: hypothetical protein KatS3mg083_529 [Candidatus Dojkabacteria bacterium]|nr:MAG: hypothetical protein KatS3mg083_529 [Candidatus Dojkabacteria bacterium]